MPRHQRPRHRGRPWRGGMDAANRQQGRDRLLRRGRAPLQSITAAPKPAAKILVSLTRRRRSPARGPPQRITLGADRLKPALNIDSAIASSVTADELLQQTFNHFD